MTEQTAGRLALSLERQSLIVVCGAGLSLAPPSKVPLATTLAQNWRDKYELTTGMILPAEIGSDLEKLANYFIENKQLHRALPLVDWGTFMNPPNGGHTAIADFLGCKAIIAAATLNVDFLVEQAASRLGEPYFQSALDGVEANEDHPHHPYVKLHGCIQKDPRHTVWSSQQIEGPFADQVVAQRIGTAQHWLRGALQGRDLLIIGFWTDWEYLNSTLGAALTNTQPASITVVDVQDEAQLQLKAPDLWRVCHKQHVHFELVQQSGRDFLKELRMRFSRQFLERLYREAPQIGANAPVGLPENLTESDLYDRRRDACGVPVTAIVRERVPQQHMATVARVHAALLANGAEVVGPFYSANEQTIRVVNGAGALLAQVRARYSREPAATYDIVICAGAEDDGTPADLVRNETDPDIVRSGVTGTWLTIAQAQELGIL